MEELRSNTELREEVASWVASVRSRLEADTTRKRTFLGPFREPWTHALALGEVMSAGLRWRELAPNPKPRLRCVQVAHHHCLLDWPAPDFIVLRVRPDNLFDPPARADMLEALRAHLGSKASIGDVLKAENSFAVVISGVGEIPERISGFTLRRFSPEEVEELPPATQSGPRAVTVASPRIDAVAAGVLKPSREQIKKHLESGGVLLNYRPARKSGTELAAGDVVAVRDGGRFRLLEILGSTRKGRVKIEVELLNGP